MMLSLLLLAGCQDEESEGVAVFSPDSEPFGDTYPEWAVAWWEWVLSIPYESDPVRGGPCDQNQPAENVWFMAGGRGGEEMRDCTVPNGRALFFPVLNENCFSCPEVFGVGDCDYLDEAGLLSCLEFPVPGLTEVLQVDLDGVAVEDVEDWVFTSEVFEIHTPDDNLSHLYYEDPSFDCGDPWEDGNLCGAPTGEIKLMITAGYYLMLEPLEPGEHTLHIHGGIVEAEWYTDVTYNLTQE